MIDKPLRIAIAHDDGFKRCPWPGVDPLYVDYHDTEWGVPEWDSRALFEKLILDGFQAGLSWITILRKRDAFRKAFDNFEPEKIVRYKPAKIEKLMLDAGIVRNRAKIESTVKSAGVWLDIESQGRLLQLSLEICRRAPAAGQAQASWRSAGRDGNLQKDFQGSEGARV